MSKISFKENIKRTVAVATVASMILATGCGSQGADAAGSAATETTVQSNTESEETTEVAIASDSFEGKWMMVRYASGDTAIEYDRLGDAGMTDNTYFDLKADGSGTFSLAGSPMDVKFHDGKVSVSGVDLYSYTFAEPDVLEVDMAGSIYTMAREGSASLAAYQGVTTASSDNLYADQAHKDVSYRHLMAGEKVLEVDGGVLYYEVFSNEAKISYGKVYAENLYIPVELEGKPVTAIRRLHGNIENLYLPSGLECIYSSFGDFEGIRTLTFAYDGGDCKLKMFRQGCCDYGHFKRDKLEKVVFPASVATDESISFGKSSFGEAYILSEVENMPPAWKEGVESLEKGAAMLKNPNDYIYPQSEKVTALAQEVTKGLTTDSDKVYAICKWVVNNLVYDITGYDKYLAARDSKYYGGDYNQADITMSTVATYPDEVIDKRVAVCEGFSRLTKAMCNAVAIPAVLVTGVLPPLKDSWEMSSWHAWNMVYFDGEWKHIDTTFCNKDYNAQIVLTKEGELDETIAKDDAITYEDYMNNSELQEDYTWEEIEAINKYTEETQGFDARHYYYCLPATAMGADHIAYYVDDMVIPGVDPLKK